MRFKDETDILKPSIDASLGQSIDEMIRGVEAAVSPASPPNSLFE